MSARQTAVVSSARHVRALVVVPCLLLATACARKAEPTPPPEPARDVFAEFPRTAGTLRRDATSLARAGVDFGGRVRTRPAAVLEPIHTDQVVQAVRWARAHRVRVVPRGNGHSMEGQTQGDGALVIDMRGLHAVVSVNPERIVVEAGATWRQVLDATLPRGMRPPVLPGYLGLTVGGTLSVGGVGPGSAMHGFQVDNVRALDVVTGAGELVHCTADVQADVYDAVLGGLGQFGVIVRTELALAPVPAAMTRVIADYDAVASLLADTRMVVEAAERLGATIELDARITEPLGVSPRAQLLLWVWDTKHLTDVQAALTRARSKEATTVPNLDHASFGDLHEARSRASGNWERPHRWVDIFLPAEAVEAFLSETQRAIGADISQAPEYIQLLPIRKRRTHASILQTPSVAKGALFYNVGLIQTARDADHATRIDARTKRLLAWAMAAGGRTYAIDALPDSADRWRAHLGSSARTLREIERRIDPDHVLGAALGLSLD